MKKTLLLLLAFFFYTTVHSQATITSTEYQKVTRDAVVTEIPFPEKTVANAIQDSLQKMGYKGKEIKGFTVYKGVQMPALASEPLDLYFSVDHKSRREKDYSTVIMMLSRGADNFITAASDPGIVQNAKSYLEGLVTTVLYFDLEQQIAAQEEQLRAAEKKARNLAEDGDDLRKKKKKVEEQIEDNNKDQSDQRAEIQKQQQALESLKSKRKQ